MIIVISEYFGINEDEFQSMKLSNPEYFFFRSLRECIYVLKTTDLLLDVIKRAR